MYDTALAELEQFLLSQQRSQEWPSLRSYNIDADDPNTVSLNLFVPEDLAYFRGHFPDQPVLPGVVQVHWAGECAKRLFRLSSFKTLQGAKFNNMVLPDSGLTLRLSFKSDKNSVRYVFARDDETCSLGTFVFSECAA